MLSLLLIISSVFIGRAMSKYLVVNSNKPDIKPVRLKIDVTQNFLTYDSLTSFIRETLHMNDTLFSLEMLDNALGKYSRIVVDKFEGISWNSGYLTLLMIEEDTIHADFLCIQGRSFSLYEGIPIGSEGLSLTIKERGDAALGTGLNVWDGSIVLAKYLELHPHLIRGKRTLELGAGTGVAGIAAGLLGASHITLTDLDYALFNLRANSQHNFDQLSGSRQQFKEECSGSAESVGGDSLTYSVDLLDWADSGTYLSDEHFDVVLGADIVWLEHLVPLLQKALHAHMKPGTLLILAHQVSRSSDVHMLIILWLILETD